MLSAQTRPDALPPLDSLDLAGMKRIAGQLFGTALSLEKELKEEEPIAGSAQGLASNHLMLAKLDSTVSKSQIDSLTKEAKLAEQAYKKTLSRATRAGKIARFAEPLYEMDSLNLRKNLPKAWQQIRQLYDELYPPLPAVALAKEGANQPESPDYETPKAKKEKKKDAASNPAVTNQPITNLQKKFAAYDPAADVMLRPPTPPCVIASSSRDEFSGETSRQMAHAELFRFTNPALKTYLQGKTHIVCQAALASVGPNAALHLLFTINDPNARKAFGRLDKNSIATLKFMDGSTFTLQNAVPDDGVFNPDTEATIFRAQYPIAPDVLKKLRRTELDKLRIAWSNGYDDYEVQQVDLLMRQAECLFK